jgi:hypothetical protein
MFWSLIAEISIQQGLLRISRRPLDAAGRLPHPAKSRPSDLSGWPSGRTRSTPGCGGPCAGLDCRPASSAARGREALVPPAWFGIVEGDGTVVSAHTRVILAEGFSW